MSLAASSRASSAVIHTGSHVTPRNLSSQLCAGGGGRYADGTWSRRSAMVNDRSNADAFVAALGARAVRISR